MRLLAEHSADTTAPPQAVWDVWADPARRPLWHPRLEWARMEGPLVPGARGRWKPRGARPVAVRVETATPARRLVITGIHGLPVARGHYEHEVEPLPGGGSRITHRMSLSGPLARPLARVLGGMLAVSASPEALRAVARLAEGEAER